MASIANTAFEVKVSNITRNDTQNIAGKFGSFDGSTFTGDVCAAGFLCVKNSLTACEGYEGYGPEGADILNGNSWYMVAATDGTSSGTYGDHTGIYACNSYNVRRVSSGANTWNLGNNFLGLEVPADEFGDFTELIVGEQYAFGTGNFSTLPADADSIYCTIDDGLLVASDTEPTGGSGVYLKILRGKSFTVGARYAFDGYVCEVCRTAEAAA